MKTKPANIVNLNLPDKQAFAIETKPDFIKLNTLMVLNGKRGGGKTVGLCNFLREAKKENYCDKIIVVTPTYNSNKQIWDLADVQEEDVYEPETGVIRQVLDKCNAEKAEWDQFLEKKELYKQFKKDRKRPVHLIDDENLINYYMFNF